MKRLVLIFMLGLLAIGAVWGQVNISAGNTVAQDFNIGTSTTASLPTGWKADKNSTVRSVGSYASAGSATERLGGNSMSSSASNGIYNYAAGDPGTAIDRAVGGLSSSSASKSVNVYVKLTNNGSSAINNLTISYDVEKYRNGSNSAGFSIQMYYSTDGSSWTSAGSDFLTSFSADANNDGYTSAPGATVSINNKSLNQEIEAGSSIYLAWNYSVSSGTTTSYAQAIGIDNVSITANGTAGNQAPSISDIQRTPSGSINTHKTVSVSATVTDDVSVEDVILKWWTTDPEDYTTIDMSANGDVYTTESDIPAHAAGTTVSFYIEAMDDELEITDSDTYDYTVVAAQAPVISDITTSPTTGITSLDAVYISAEITDADGTIEDAELNWGTTSGTYPNEINMSAAKGTYTSDSAIPAQAIGTTVYFVVDAMDDDTDFTRSTEQSYTVLAPTPILTIDPTNLSGFTYRIDSGPSEEQAFTVSGQYLTANISISAPTNYEISETSGSGYTSSITLTQSGGSVSETTIYVRLKAGLSAGSYNNENVTSSSTGAVDKAVTCSGSVVPAEYLVDFENESSSLVSGSTGYDLGVYTLNSLDWNVGPQALIGADSGDMKNGNRSARIRYNNPTYGSLTMIEAKTDGIGTISFHYARSNFSGDREGTAPSFVVEYSVNDGQWVQTGDEVNLDGVDTLTLFSSVINEAGSVKIRIRQTAGDSGKRWNVDDVIVTDFTYDYPNGQAVAVDDNTITVVGGGANNGSGEIPSIPNTNVSYTSYIFELDDSVEQYTITIATEALWGAYYQNDTWNVSQSNEGVVTLVINPTPAKGTVNIPVILGDQDPTLPIELSSFTYTINANNMVSLMWITQSETNVSGFRVYRGETETLAEALMISDLIPASNTSTTQSYVFVDRELSTDGEYYYWLENLDMDGSNGFHGPIMVQYTVNQSGNPDIPLVTGLNRIYPNPFNPTTYISYSLAEDSPVMVEIFNQRGQLVRRIADAPAREGNHRIEWNGTDDNGRPVSTGLYLVRLMTGNQSFVRKAILMK